MITELEKKVHKNTLLIDDLLTKYFVKNLGRNDSKTITTLNANGKFSFVQKVKLFSDLATMPKLDKAKFKVYAKINNDLASNDILDPNYFDSIRNYHPFLMNTYLTGLEVLSLKEKLLFSIDLFSNDIVKLTKIYTEKPQLYYQKKTKNIFSR